MSLSLNISTLVDIQGVLEDTLSEKLAVIHEIYTSYVEKDPLIGLK